MGGEPLERACGEAARAIFGEALIEEPKRWTIGGRPFSLRVFPRGLARVDGEASAGELWLLPYVSPKQAEELRARKIAYMDSAGNAWISQPPLWAWIEGRPKPPPLRRGRPPLLEGGLRVTLYLIAVPEEERLNESYRVIAERAEVALGTVANTIGFLREQGYIVPGQGRLRFADRAGLERRWREGYAEILRPTLYVGSARALPRAYTQGPTSLDALRRLADQAAAIPDTRIGGEYAAALLTNNLVPQRLALHTSRPASELYRSLRLLPDPNGNIDLFQRLSSKDIELDGTPLDAHWPIIHPLFIQAELEYQRDARLSEITRQIRHEPYDVT